MINSRELFKLFIKNNINFFSGVPDSVLKDFLNILESNKKLANIKCVNEGSAVSLAIGNYLGTKKVGLAYMQNSGLGNAINPLVSIAEKTVYSIPVILLIGWRGSPNSNDEPQHIAKGKITRSILDSLDIKYTIPNNKSDFLKITSLINYSKKNKKPVAILIKNKILKKENLNIKKNLNKSIMRSTFIYELLKNLNKKDRIISTTGYTSRELNQIRENNNIKNSKDFYMVGGMGHAAAVALGHTINNKKRVICLDGDGSMLMHLGSLVTVANYGSKNYKYILLNNNAHESVGGYKTHSDKINMKNFSKSLYFRDYFKIDKKTNLNKTINRFLKSKGPSFLEVIIKNKSMNDLKRPRNLKKILSNFIN